jgi:hypothetical protein
MCSLTHRALQKVAQVLRGHMSVHIVSLRRCHTQHRPQRKDHCRLMRKRLQADARSVQAAGLLLDGNVLRLSLSDDALGSERVRTAALRLQQELREMHARFASCQLRCQEQGQELERLRVAPTDVAGASSARKVHSAASCGVVGPCSGGASSQRCGSVVIKSSCARCTHGHSFAV